MTAPSRQTRSDPDVPPPAGPALPPIAWRPLGLVLLAQVVVLTALSWRYGFHRDELYFLVAGRHPAWGYVDQPPLTPMLARASTAVFGDTPMGLRVVATAMSAATVLIATVTAREFGGRRNAQVLTAISTALSTYVLVVGHMVSTASADLLVWTATGLLILRVLRTGEGRWWLAVGAVVGIGILDKWLVVLLVAAIGVAVLITGPRRPLQSPWLIAGIAVAVAIALPTLIWQARHDWPQFTVARGISDQDGTANRIMFVPDQLVYLSPVLVPVYLAGLVRMWRDPRIRWARPFTLAYPILCVVILATGGKPYYAVPLLLIALAAGAEPALDWLRRNPRRVKGIRGFAAVCIAVSVVIGLPVLPPPALNPVLAANAEAGEQVGWPRLVDTVARVWRRIPPDQRATAVVLTTNYGQAGAIAQYGPARGLPQPYSGHMSFADWGPPPDSHTGPVVLVGDFSSRLDSFRDCRVITHNDNGDGVDNDEQGTPISLCAGTSAPWAAIWPGLRRYY